MTGESQGAGDRGEGAETQDGSKRRERLIGVYIGVLAVILAICSMGGGNAAKEATIKNIEAANIWSFFQAKNMRRQVLRGAFEEMELWLLKEPQMPETARAAIADKIENYRRQVDILTSDKKSNEGLDELWMRGKALEAERDIAMRRDPYFDYGQALLQIAIVLASVALISSSGLMILAASVMLGIFGTILTLNGFFLFMRLAYIG